MSLNNVGDSDIAIIGMMGRFPGANTVKTFWEKLKNQQDTVTFFSDEELADTGVMPDSIQHPNYVKANQILPEIEMFDADFFQITKKEAEIIDPQQRIFLECAYEALENAGYNPEVYDGIIGVYVGIGMNTYALDNLSQKYKDASSVERYQLMLANDKDYLATRISYKLNLKGPSMNINTACSTSLVAIHMACLSLLNGECDMALTGSASIRVPQIAGYLHQEGMIFSPDGHCRAFDAKAQGTVLGDGVGVVILKRISDALADGDTIHAVIKGSAINNDGSLKAGYTAPSFEGQQSVITEAQAISGIDAETITYVEAHGTGTNLGDPVEIAALTEAFRKQTKKRGFCAIGSVKTNIGHLDAAAGMAGMIKTVLMLKNKTLVPSLHYESPNSDIDFENSPFFVQTHVEEWKANGNPRRAGVSAFGIGGTNSHIVLEEAPQTSHVPQARQAELLILSAKTESALDQITNNLAKYLKQNPQLNLGNVAYTLSIGRKSYPYRKILVCKDIKDAALTLALSDENRVFAKQAQDIVDVEHVLRDVNSSPAIAAKIQQQSDTNPLDLTLLASQESDVELICHTVGSLWLRGVEIDWNSFYMNRSLQRISLPTYPFEKKRYWIESKEKKAKEKRVNSELLEKIKAANPANRRNLVIRHLQDQISSIIGDGATLPDPEQNLMEIQLDSLILIEIVAKLGIKLNLSIPSSALIEYPTITTFADNVILTLGLNHEEKSEKKLEETSSDQSRKSRRDSMEERRKLRQSLRA